MIAYTRFNQAFVSQKAYGIADWLIDIYEIQDGLGLAHHLKVPNQLSNHDAVRVWVQQQLQSRPPAFQTLGDVRTALGSLLP